MIKNKKITIPHSALRIPHSERGFTLVELAMVLVVLGLLIGLGTSLIGPLMKQAKVVESRETVKSAKAALMGFAVKSGYLPTTIGPSGARELDAWGRALSYAADTTLLLTSTNACNRTNTDRTIFECTNTACTTANTKSNIAFIVYSTGEDAEGTGTTTQPTGGPVCPSGTCYWISEQASSYTVGPTTYYYDDIVQYVTLDEIRNAMGCSFNITTQTLPDAKVGTAYNVTGVQLQASGGQTQYSWAVSGQTAGTFGCTNTCTGACNAAGTCSTGLNGICSFPITGSNTGLCLDSNSTAGTGVLSGTPTTANVYNFTVTLTDANAVTTSKAFTLNVIETLAITNQTLPDARTGSAYSVTLNGTGGTGTYAWTTSQAQGACPAGTFQIVVTNIGLCLNTTTGVLSSAIVATPYPITAGVYNFTVTLTANAITSRVFTLNVIDSCAAGGINVANSTTASRYYKKNNATTGSTGCTTWASGAIVNVLPVDILYPFTASGCATRSCTTTYPAPNYMRYSVWQATDVNENCSTSWLTYGAAVCAPQDL